MKRPAKSCPPSSSEHAATNGNGGWPAWWKLLALAAVGAVVALGSVLYTDLRDAQRDLELRVRTDVRDLEARVRTAETRQAVVEASLGDVKAELRSLNGKVDELLRRAQPAAAK